MSEDELLQALQAPFDEREVKFKPAVVTGNRALALPYVDARVIQDRLDRVFKVGGWQTEYRVLEGGSVECRLSCRLADGWVTKADVGSPSEQPDEGDRMKAAYSDALKRAAVQFGIARYLYRLAPIWADWDAQKKKFQKDPKLPASARHQATPTPEPAAPEQPATPPAEPATAAQLCDRLDEFDAWLVERGLAPKGALLAAVQVAMRDAGHGDATLSWSKPDQIRDAMGFARSFARQRQAAAGKGKKAG